MRIGAQYGVETEARVLGRKKNETMAFYRKNFIKNGRCSQAQVPLQFKTIFQSPESRTLIVQNSIESKFLQAENSNFIAFFLSKELRFFETSKVYFDGTFDICRNFSDRFCQLYIISTTQTVLDRVISTPIAFFYMKSRRAADYNLIFEFLSEKFEEEFGRKLFPKKIMLDCEMAVIKSAQKIWPGVKLGLCRVHIRRNLDRKFVEIFGKNFFDSDPTMQIFKKIVAGVFYLPATTFPTLINFFKSEFRPKFVNQKQNFDKFLSYLCENYLNSNARFKPSMWNSYTQVCDYQDTDNTTNPLESLNNVLKGMTRAGRVNFTRSCEILYKFKIRQMRRYYDARYNNGGNRKGRETLRKNEATLETMQMFSSDCILTDPKSLSNFAIKFSTYDVDAAHFEIFTEL